MKVINLFGGGGAGKSTTRAGVFNLLKLKGVNCEEVHEWIKAKVYEGNVYVPKDQIYVFAKQRKALREVGNAVDLIITDSPLLLSIIYDSEKDPLLKQLVLQEFNKFDNINFLIRRVKPYNPIGRYQTEEEAKDIDLQIEQMLKENNIPYISVDGDESAKDFIVSCLI